MYDLYDDEPEYRLSAPRRARAPYVVVAGITAGIVALVLTVALCERLGLFTATESPQYRALNGQPITVDLRAGTATVVYSDVSDTSDVQCVVTGHSETPVAFERLLNPFRLQTPDGTWHAALWVRAELSGTYEIQCTGMAGGYGIGDDGRITSFLGERIFLFGVPGAAVAGGIVAGVVVWLFRRPRSRRDIHFYLS